MAQKTDASKIDTAIMKALNKYADDIQGNLDAITKSVARAGARELQQKSASTFKGEKYQKGWKVQINQSRTGASATIYNQRPGLPHLLEHGHAKRNGGRVEGRPHIAPVETELIEKYQKEIVAKL